MHHLLLERRALGGTSCGSCSMWAQLLHSMWNLLGAEIEPMSPVLAGGFLTTGPPGRSSWKNFKFTEKTVNCKDSPESSHVPLTQFPLC